MYYSFCYLFLFFLVYSFIGYLVEVCFCSISTKKIILNRGFLIGPYLPIYGISVVVMYYSLQKYATDPLALFVMACIVCSIVEYFTSLVLEKIFKIRWWDYSQMRFNLEGRICLSNSILFGLGSLVLFYIVNPRVIALFNLLSDDNLIIVSTILIIIFTVDLIISVSVLNKIKTQSKNFSSKDATEEVIELRNEELKKNNFLLTRLLNAFPKISGKNMDRYIAMKKKVNEIRKKYKLNKKEEKRS